MEKRLLEWVFIKYIFKIKELSWQYMHLLSYFFTTYFRQ